MIQGFEEETAPLSAKELELVPIFVGALKQKIGKDKAVTNTDIRAGMKSAKGINVPPSRVRKIINYIRMNDLVPCLIATSAGYYISQNKEELKKYIESLMGRERAIRAIRQQIEKSL